MSLWNDLLPTPYDLPCLNICWLFQIQSLNQSPDLPSTPGPPYIQQCRLFRLVSYGIATASKIAHNEISLDHDDEKLIDYILLVLPYTIDWCQPKRTWYPHLSKCGLQNGHNSLSNMECVLIMFSKIILKQYYPMTLK